jgi:lipoprotein-anchoring transpeptidase ErfK/SrfK
MFSAHHWRLAVSALAATILSSASAFAEPLAMADPLPFPGSIFQQIFRDPSPQAYPDQSAPDDQAYPQQAEPEDSVTDEAPGVTRDQFRKQIVAYNSNEAPGTIVIDTPHTYLYYVLGQGRAIRYGIGVGRDGFRWAGVQTVARKQEWPDWHPPAAMIARQPYLPRFMAGGPDNPLGARAMYLGNTEYRIHGTNDPTTIGKRVSSGCIRLTNANVEDLYNRVTVGTKVIVLPDNGYQARRSEPVREHLSRRSSHRVSMTLASDAPLPPAAVPNGARESLSYGSSASRLY